MGSGKLKWPKLTFFLTENIVLIPLHEEKNFFQALLEIGCLLFKDGVCIDSQHVKLESKRIKTVEIRTKLVPEKLCDFQD